MSSRPFTIVIAAVLEALIGMASAFGGIYSFYTAVTGQAADPVSSAMPLTLIGVGVGVLLVFVAYSLWQLRDWARTPVVVTQLFMAVLAYYMFTGGQHLVGAVMIVTAVVATAAVLAPPTTAVLFPGVEEKRR